MSGMISLRDLRGWERELDQGAERFGPLMGRVEMQVQGARYLRGLIAQVDRKNGWQLADHLGEETPTNLQHFIARAAWSADDVRDELQRYVQEHPAEPEGVLIVDETGFLKIRGRRVPGSHGCIPARQAGSRIARSESFWRTPP